MDDLSLGEIRRRHRGRHLSLACRRCGWSAAPPVALLAAELGHRTTLAEAIARLGYRGCGARPATLGLTDVPPRQPHATAAA
jgi:hypothetical protein